MIISSQWSWIDNCFGFDHECLQRFFIQTVTKCLQQWSWYTSGWTNLVLPLWSILLNALTNSYSNPTKFGPLLKCICLTFPILVISFLRAWMKESVVILCETSMCTALLVRQVNIAAYFKYWVGDQQGQSYLMGRRCLFSLAWPPF